MILSILSIANRDLFSISFACESEKIVSMDVFDAGIIKICLLIQIIVDNFYFAASRILINLHFVAIVNLNLNNFQIHFYCWYLLLYRIMKKINHHY